MNQATRLTALFLILATSPATHASAQEGPARRVLRLALRSRPAFRTLTLETPRMAEPAPAAAASVPQGPSDPYGFAAILNSYRAAAGLPPVAYDPGLSSWAARNNVRQCLLGLGHHINPGCSQNCGWNYADAHSAAQGWMGSPGHRANMLGRSITRFGIAHGPGPYWTLNAR